MSDDKDPRITADFAEGTFDALAPDLSPGKKKGRATVAGERYSAGVDDLLASGIVSKDVKRAQHFTHGWLERDGAIFVYIQRKCADLGVEFEGGTCEQAIDHLLKAVAAKQ